MKKILLIIAVIISINIVACRQTKQIEKPTSENIPMQLKGDFKDDYGIQFTINDSIWVQHPNVKYHIISWDTTAQYLLARNDLNNPSEPGLYTRIDYTNLQGMKPFKWGFCLTEYKAKTIGEAQANASADKNNPKKGCNGYPFSRMKRVY